MCAYARDELQQAALSELLQKQPTLPQMVQYLVKDEIALSCSARDLCSLWGVADELRTRATDRYYRPLEYAFALGYMAGRLAEAGHSDAGEKLKAASSILIKSQWEKVGEELGHAVHGLKESTDLAAVTEVCCVALDELSTLMGEAVEKLRLELGQRESSAFAGSRVEGQQL